jgi:hypothetical protein
MIAPALAGPSSAAPATEADLARFFSEFGQLLTTAASHGPSVETEVLQAFFEDASQVFAEASRRQRELDRTQATRFNVFGLIEPDENKLSDILADLLDPEGRHGQGSLFLTLLLRQLDSKLVHDAAAPVRIVREAPTHGIQRFRRRIDILVDADVLLAIENKIDSPEQWEQVKDYLEYLRVHSRDWRTPAYLIYLTPNGRRPTSLLDVERADHEANNRLICWSYQRELRQWLDSCWAACEADKIRHFLADFTAYVDSVLNRQVEPSESDTPQ